MVEEGPASCPPTSTRMLWHAPPYSSNKQTNVILKKKRKLCVGDVVCFKGSLKERKWRIPERWHYTLRCRLGRVGTQPNTRNSGTPYTAPITEQSLEQLGYACPWYMHHPMMTCRDGQDLEGIRSGPQILTMKTSTVTQTARQDHHGSQGWALAQISLMWKRLDLRYPSLGSSIRSWTPPAQLRWWPGD